MKKPGEIDIGFKIPEPKLWVLDLPFEEILISEIEYNLDIPYLEKEGTDDWNLSIRELVENFDKEFTHSKKAEQSDLSYPIELYFFRDKWIILDGVHRLAKAVQRGDKTIKVRKIPQSAINKLF